MSILPLSNINGVVLSPEELKYRDDYYMKYFGTKQYDKQALCKKARRKYNDFMETVGYQLKNARLKRGYSDELIKTYKKGNKLLGFIEDAIIPMIKDKSREDYYIYCAKIEVKLNIIEKQYKELRHELRDVRDIKIPKFKNVI